MYYLKTNYQPEELDVTEELWNYIETNNSRELIILLKMNKSLNLNQSFPSKGNLTPLQYAEKNGLTTIYNILFNHDYTKAQQTPLHTAVIDREVSAVKGLLETDDVELLLMQQDHNGYYPLDYACVDFEHEMTGKFFPKNKNLEKINTIIEMILAAHIQKSIPYANSSELPL